MSSYKKGALVRLDLPSGWFICETTDRRYVDNLGYADADQAVEDQELGILTGKGSEHLRHDGSGPALYFEVYWQRLGKKVEIPVQHLKLIEKEQ